MNSNKIENIVETLAHLNYLIKYIAYYSHLFLLTILLKKFIN